MTKYNRSEVFKKAWRMVKNNGLTMSEALKRSWKSEKQRVKDLEFVATYMPTHRVKDWFYNKNFEKFNTRTTHCSQAFRMEDVVKESEKAICIAFEADYKNGEGEVIRNIWVPKSCVEEIA